MQDMSKNMHSDVSVGVFVATAFASAFAFGIGYDLGVTAFWDQWNRGVSTVLISCLHCVIVV